MRAEADHGVTFAKALQDVLIGAEDGAVSIVSADGVRHMIYSPVTIGPDYVKFAMGPGPEYPTAIVPFKTMASVIV